MKRFLGAKSLREVKDCVMERDILAMELQQAQGHCRRLARLWLPEEGEEDHPLRKDIRETVDYMDSLMRQLVLISEST